ncbi:MAG TPA: type 4a pilus biogenesis protein PilO, partial [Kofleriaceae bacterium]|nr:type 4a pilus biogenesis protein PilO [Kofleriaceae bacterium]
EAAQSEHDQKVARNRQLADDIPRYAELRAHMATIRALIEKNQTALPSEAELPAFFETLQHKIAESGVEMRKWSNRPEEAVESFMKVPVEVEISGTFMQIKRFFASLIQPDVRPSAVPERPSEERERAERERAERERIVSIENLALTNPTVKNREIVLDARFTAVTFRQEDKQTPADRSAGGKPGSAGAAPPSAGAPPRSSPPPPLPSAATSSPASPASPPPPPPLPGAATPAGARARTERALETGAARSRDAAGGEDAKPRAGDRDRLKGGL